MSGPALLVAPDEVRSRMGVHRRGGMSSVPSRRPKRLAPSPAPAAPTQPTECVIDRIEGFLDDLGAETADVVLLEDGRQVEYTMPAERFHRLGIREGDRFWFEAVERAGKVAGRVVRAEPEPGPPAPERYLTPDELSASADPWT